MGRAIPLYEATLVRYEEILGSTHPDTAGSRNNLACARSEGRSSTAQTYSNFGDRDCTSGAVPGWLSSPRTIIDLPAESSHRAGPEASHARRLWPTGLEPLRLRRPRRLLRGPG
ncbi:tetratricopeptide repeat protein [Streptomyces sp. NPDC059445]|uniref:tetratricopeptide repeat protein n=1 Tax=Streptomyces sp. NPDC059445 TaxID=3346832 RepID=UPI003681872E